MLPCWSQCGELLMACGAHSGAQPLPLGWLTARPPVKTHNSSKQHQHRFYQNRPAGNSLHKRERSLETHHRGKLAADVRGGGGVCGGVVWSEHFEAIGEDKIRHCFMATEQSDAALQCLQLTLLALSSPPSIWESEQSRKHSAEKSRHLKVSDMCRATIETLPLTWVELTASQPLKMALGHTKFGNIKGQCGNCALRANCLPVLA
ncbi:hypothetical protein KUCAC02_027214, partial [Chaenocephalus aceratus]